MHLLMVESDYCVMRFAYALHMRSQNLVYLSCLYAKPFELDIEIVFRYCTTPFCHKIDLFKRPFQGSLFERVDDIFVLPSCSLASSFSTLRKSSFLSDYV